MLVRVDAALAQLLDVDADAARVTAVAPGVGVRAFRFDALFDAGPQAAVYERAARRLVVDWANGANATVVLYGQTGSGKTYTMEGPAGEPGINRRALDDLRALVAGFPGSAVADDAAEAPALALALGAVTASSSAPSPSVPTGLCQDEASPGKLQVTGLSTNNLASLAVPRTHLIGSTR